MTQVANLGSTRIAVPDNYGILRCEICRADLAKFLPENLTLPLTAEMFSPLLASASPFPRVSGLTIAWEHVRCPMCRKRPFIKRDTIMTPHGPMKVGEKSVPKPITKEMEEGKKRQEQINRVWIENNMDDLDRDLTMDDLRELYPGASQASLNQRMINMIMKEDEEEEDEDEPVEVLEKVSRETKEHSCKYGCGFSAKHITQVWRHQTSCPNRSSKKKRGRE